MTWMFWKKITSHSSLRDCCCWFCCRCCCCCCCCWKVSPKTANVTAHIQATSDSKRSEASCSILAQVCTRNSRWYSSKIVSSMFQRPWVLIRLFRTVARSRSSQRCKPCSRDWDIVMSLGPHSMYSSIDFTCKKNCNTNFWPLINFSFFPLRGCL